MQLYSLAFILFMAALLVVYYTLGRVVGKGQWVVLLVASLAFYCLVGRPETLVFLVITALLVWAAALALAKLDARFASRKAEVDRSQRKALKKKYTNYKRLVLLATLLLAFGVLAYLKYWNTILWGLGKAKSPTSLGLLLPLGISFYTFAAISYLIDTYNKKIEAEKNFLHFLLFVSYFPAIIQGPINRYKDLSKELFAPHRLEGVNLDRGMLRFGYGCLKKFAIADILVPKIAAIFDIAHPDKLPGSVLAFGILMYSAYQYADFSGGIDMVEGISEALDIHMAENFKRPYFSVSLADFWRRWHITLGAWMRDYVFYPLALTKPMQHMSKFLSKHIGKHLGRTLPASIANIVVFLLVGIWHGPEMHYVAWGLYNGVVIALSDICSPLWQKLNQIFHTSPEGKAHRIFSIIRTFLVVNIGWYFDRIADAATAWACLGQTFVAFSPHGFRSHFVQLGLSVHVIGFAVVGLVCLIVFFMSVVEERGVDIRSKIFSHNFVVRALIYIGVILLILLSFPFSAEVPKAFMYANF